MLAVLRGDADVLVCTSISRSGIDVPQANTLLVERSDTFGLAQLYQIRGGGWGGRSRRAYAYLLYPSAAALTPDAAQDCPPFRTTRSSAPASRSRCATWRSAAPATCSATSSPGTSRRSDSSFTCRCSTRRWRAATAPTPTERLGAGAPRRERRRVRAGGATSPTSRRKVDVHRRIAGAREVADLSAASRRARGPLRRAARAVAQPARAPAGADQARSGRRARVTFRDGRLAVTPIELDSVRAKRIRQEIPEALYESGKSQLSLRVPEGRSSASPRSSRPPTCCWRSRAKPRRAVCPSRATWREPRYHHAPDEDPSVRFWR